MLFASILLLLMIAIRDHIADFINKLWVIPVMSKMFDNALWYFLAASLILTVYYWLACRNERYKSQLRIDIIAFISILYALSFLYSTIEVGKGWQFSYYSALIIVIPYMGELFLFTKRRKFQSNQDNNCSLIYENPIVKADDDSYKRINYCRIVSQKITNNFHKEGAFVIGISGNWGFGKTSFLNLIEENIDKNKIDIKFDFKPWLSSSTNAIVSDFFTQLSEELSVFIPNLQVKLNEYAETVSEVTNDSWLKGGLKLIKLGLTDSSEKQYEKIKTILEKSRLKVLVFIDDTDRLSPEEILEMFRLVRNTANFPYLQFLITYDRDYLLKTLNVVNPEKYIEKIFNLEISLPVYDSSVIRESLVHEFNRCSAIDKVHLEIIRKFLLHFNDDFPVEQIIRTQRDVIRFTNALSVNVEAFVCSLESCTLEDIDILDFVKLELIRYRFHNFYNILALSPLSMLDISKTHKESFAYRQKKPEVNVDSNAGEQSISDFDLENLFEEEEEYNLYSGHSYIKQEDLFDTCMNNIFPQLPVDSNKSVSKIRSFDQYFRYRYDEKNISETEILLLLQERNETKQIQLLKDYFSSKKKREIYLMVESIVSKFNEKSWREEMESPFYYKNVLSFISAVLKSENTKLIEEVVAGCSSIFNQSLYHDLDYYLEILRLWDRIMGFDMLVHESIMIAFIYKNNLEVKLGREITQDDLLKIEKFFRETVSLEQMSNLLNHYVDPGNSESELVLSKSLLKEIQLSFFMKYAENQKVNKRCLQLFVNCADIEPDSRNFLWNEKASKKMRELIDKDPRGYISVYVIMDAMYIYPPRYWKPIFNDNSDEMENYLFAKEKDNLEGIKEARIAWELFKHNDYKEIQINDLRHKNIKQENLLVHLGQELDTILEIKETVDLIDNETVENDEADSLRKSSLLELQKRLESTHLYIRIKKDLIKEIELKLSNELN